MKLAFSSCLSGGGIYKADMATVEEAGKGQGRICGEYGLVLQDLCCHNNPD